MIEKLINPIGFTVDTHVYVHTTREANPNEAYTSDSTITDRDIIGVRKYEGRDVRNAHVLTENLFEEGQKLYLVWVSYTTGDSYGTRENAHIHYVEVYDSEDKAQECLNDILKHADDDKMDTIEDFQLDIFTNDNRIVKLYTPWKGYFEQIYSSGIYEFEYKESD